MSNGRTRAAMAVFLAAALLAGCGGASDLDKAVAGKFQVRVAAAKQLAAAQNFTGAVSELDQLSREVQLGLEQGTVSEQRHSRIEASIGKVRADLEAAQVAARSAPGPTTAAPAPSPEPSPGDREGDKAKKDEEEGSDVNKGKGKGD